METLEELREKYSNLCEEQRTLYEKIVKLEQQEVYNNFAIGECYLNTDCDSFKKIIAIDKNILYCVVITDRDIQRDLYYLRDAKCWKKITSKQFKDIYIAVLKDIQNPNLDNNKKSNWNIVYNSIMNSINKGE